MKIIRAQDEAPPVDQEEGSFRLPIRPGLKEVAKEIQDFALGYPLERLWGAEPFEPLAEEVKFFPGARLLIIHFPHGVMHTFHADSIEELQGLEDDELAQIRVAFAGRALTLDRKDIDISVAGLLRKGSGQGGRGASGEDFDGELGRPLY
jgi:hypothetical protein